MDLRSGYPLWLVTSGLPYTYPKLERNLKKDVVILGGGISGALTAHYLTKSGFDCTIVDARTIGLGSTCASTALLQYQIDTTLTELTEMIGIENATRAFERSANAVDELEILAKEIGYSGYARKKTLFYASSIAHGKKLEREYKLHKKAGFSVQFWDQTLIKDRFGFSAPAALFSDHSAQCDSYTLTHALLQFNVLKGLTVFDRTSVTKIEHTAKGVKLTTEGGVIIQAKKLIYATGYESVNYIDEKIVDLHSTYAIAGEQMNEGRFWYADALIWETKNPYLYMRSTSDNRVVVGGRDEPFYNPAKRDALLGKKSRQLTKDLGKVFPQLEFNVEFSWTGTFASTKDGLPYIGQYPKLPNSLFALGFGGNGITFSVIAAQMITDLLLGKKNRDLNLYSFGR
ncbi:MAG: FAD-binding oxidoreductase [Chitinophagaceae bacterium]|nr:FAD-binding oxidoreductase [Chitinophagaceae bacterium]